MIEELRTLLSVFKELPDLALWAAIGFLIYKLSIIGSIYGVIRLGIEKWHDWATKKKVMTTEFRMQDKFNGIIINDEDVLSELIFQNKRIAGKGIGFKTNYIHGCSVEWLRQAIDEKEDRDKLKELEKEVEQAEMLKKEVDIHTTTSIERLKKKLKIVK
jgi:hypothetical protein